MLMLEGMVASMHVSLCPQGAKGLASKVRTALALMGPYTEPWRDRFVDYYIVDGVGVLPLIKYVKTMPSASDEWFGFRAAWCFDTRLFSPKDAAVLPTTSPNRRTYTNGEHGEGDIAYNGDGHDDSALYELVRKNTSSRAAPSVALDIQVALIKLVGERATYPFSPLASCGATWYRLVAEAEATIDTPLQVAIPVPIPSNGSDSGIAPPQSPPPGRPLPVTNWRTRHWVAFFAECHSRGYYGSGELQVMLDVLVDEMIAEAGLENLRARVCSILRSASRHTAKFANIYTNRYVVDGRGYVPLMVYRPYTSDENLGRVHWIPRFHSLHHSLATAPAVD